MLNLYDPNQLFLVLDFETFSECDLKKTSSYEYSLHPSTEILCVSYRLGTRSNLRKAKVKTYAPKRPWNEHRDDLRTYGQLKSYLLNEEIIIIAHNSMFEQSIIKNVMKFEVPHNRFLCTAVQASVFALPRKLEGATEALSLDHQKDKEGHALMLKLSKPRKPTKNNPSTRHNDPARFDRLVEYCEHDIYAETELFLTLKLPLPSERALWVFDQEINFRGIQVDRELVKTILKMIADEKRLMTEELRELTNGDVQTGGQGEEIKKWLRRNDCHLPDLKAKTVEDAIKEGLVEGDAKRVLELRQLLNKTSLKKYTAFLAHTLSDSRARLSLIFNGASPGRWCLEGQTEVLTYQGWKRFDECDGTEKIAQWCTTGKIYFKKSNILIFDNMDKLININNKFISCSFTPDHTIPTLTSRGKFKKIKAIETLKKRNDIITSGLLTSNFCEDIITRVLVMVQADGSYTKNIKKGLYLRFHFKKERKINRCVELLTQANIDYNLYYNSDESILITVLLNKTFDWINNFSDKIFKYKYNFNPAIFIDELRYWDSFNASETNFEYSTNIKANADFAQTMAHLCNFTGKVSLRNNRVKHWNDSYRVSISKSYFHRVDTSHVTIKNEIPKKVYCAETETGYFLIKSNGLIQVTGNTGSGVQFHNLPRGTLKHTDEDGKETDLAPLAADLIKQGHDLEFIRSQFENPMEVFVSCIRGMITASPGKELFIADFAAIEARMLFWLANHTEGCTAFAKGAKMYEEMAMVIFNIKDISKVSKFQRFVGKEAILGSGYGMGWKKFQSTCLEKGREVTTEVAKLAINSYREKHKAVPTLWKNIEKAAVSAVENPTKTYKINHTEWYMEGRFLACRLPSGRSLYYCDPRVKYERTPWGQKKAVLSFMGVHPKTKKWVREHTWGGKLVENCVQAISRDLMASAMVGQKEAGYTVILTVHDEIIAERNIGEGTIEEFNALMRTLPKWAVGAPVNAEGFISQRYRK